MRSLDHERGIDPDAQGYAMMDLRGLAEFHVGQKLPGNLAVA